MKTSAKDTNDSDIVAHQKLVSLNVLKILLVGLLVFAVVIASGTLVYLNNNSAKNSKTASIIVMSQSKVLKSQETARSDAYTINVKNVTENDKFDPAFTIGTDETMLIADISITNNTNSPQDVIPSVQFYIRTSDGLYYQMHPSMYVSNPLQAGKLEPGKTITGQISFAIPKILARPYLYLDLGWDNYVPIVYDILH